MEYFQKAQARVDNGAANPIESISLKSKWNEYELKHKQVKIEIKNLNTILFHMPAIQFCELCVPNSAIITEITKRTKCIKEIIGLQ